MTTRVRTTPDKTVTVTGTTASIPAANQAIVTIAIPFFERESTLGALGTESVTRMQSCRIKQIRVVRTAGTSADFDVLIHETSVSVGGGAVANTLAEYENNTTGRLDIRYDDPLIFTGDDGNIYVEIENNDGANAGTFSVALEVSVF